MLINHLTVVPTEKHPQLPFCSASGSDGVNLHIHMQLLNPLSFNTLLEFLGGNNFPNTSTAE